MSALRVVYQDDEHCIGRFHDVQINLSRAEPTLPYLETTSRLLREASRECPRGVGLIVIITPDAPPPGEEARKYLHRVLPEFAPFVLGFARVIEGQGFMAAAKRSALSVVDLFLRLPFPCKVCGTPSEAALWLHKTMGRAPHRKYSAGDLVAAIEEMRRTFERRAEVPPHSERPAQRSS